MSLSGRTDPIKKSSSADLSEDEANLDPISHLDDLAHDRMDSSVLSESANRNNNFFSSNAFANNHSVFHTESTTINGIGHTTLDSNAIRNVRQDHNYTLEPSSSLLSSELFSDTLLDDVNPFSLNLEDPLNNTSFTQHQYTPNHSNRNGEGAVSEINCYDRIYLYDLYSHGYCAPQSHYESLDRKPAARDSIHFRNNSFPQQGLNDRTYPTQAANNRNGCTSELMSDSSTSSPLSASFNSTSNRLAQDQDKVQTKLKAPPVASLPRPPQPVASPPLRSAGPSKEKNTTETKSTNLKPPPVASCLQSGRRHSQRQVNHINKSKLPKVKVNASQKCTKHTRSKTRINLTNNASTSSYRPQDFDASTLPPAHQHMMDKARTTRKQEALLTWFHRLNDLMKFKDLNGHTNVPQQYPENHSLGIWVNKQRMEKKAKDSGKASSMTDDKAQLLEEAGFVWAKRKGQTAWEEKFHELQAYLQKNGDCNVPTKNKTNRALGRWVSTQRSNYKKFMRTGSTAHPRMDQKEMNRRTNRLNGINFTWSLLPGNTQSEDIVDDNRESSSSSEKTTENNRNDDKEEKNESKRDIDGGDDKESDNITSV